MSPVLGNEDSSSSGLSTYAPALNTPASLNQSEIPSDGDAIGDRLSIGRKTIILGAKAVGSLTKMMGSQRRVLSDSSVLSDKGSEAGDTRKVVDSCSGNWTEANNPKETTKAGSTTRTNKEEAKAKISVSTEAGEIGGAAHDEDGDQDQAGQDGDSKSVAGSDLSEFEDHGGFDRYTFCNLLGTGDLDVLRLLRLKDGFLKLLEQC